MNWTLFFAALAAVLAVPYAVAAWGAIRYDARMWTDAWRDGGWTGVRAQWRAQRAHKRFCRDWEPPE